MAFGRGPRPRWLAGVAVAGGIVLILVGLVCIALGIALREFLILAGPFFVGGVYLVLNGIGLAFIRRPPQPTSAPPLELQVTSRDTTAWRIAVGAMFVGLGSAPFAFFLRGVFMGIFQLAIVTFVVALTFANRNIRCPNCGSPLPFWVALNAVRTRVASWRPTCPRCRAQI
jgi:hypothetical protein